MPTADGFMENPLNGIEFFGRRSLEKGCIIEMRKTGTFGFTYRPDIKSETIMTICYFFVVVMFANGSDSFSGSQTRLSN